MQRTSENWIAMDDKNKKFFQTTVTIRKRHNYVHKILDKMKSGRITKIALCKFLVGNFREDFRKTVIIISVSQSPFLGTFSKRTIGV